jgi:hypothetical protein
MSCDGGALRDLRSAGPMFGDGFPPAVWPHVCVSGMRPSVLEYALYMALGSASTKRFLILTMPKRQDCAKSASASNIDLNMR